MRERIFLLLTALVSLPALATSSYIYAKLSSPKIGDYGGDPFGILIIAMAAYGIALISVPIIIAQILDQLRSGKIKRNYAVVFSLIIGVATLLVPLIEIISLS